MRYIDSLRKTCEKVGVFVIVIIPIASNLSRLIILKIRLQFIMDSISYEIQQEDI